MKTLVGITWIIVAGVGPCAPLLALAYFEPAGDHAVTVMPKQADSCPWFVTWPHNGYQPAVCYEI